MSKDSFHSQMQLTLFWIIIVLWSVQGTSAFTRFSIPVFATDEWASSNNELKATLGHLHHELSAGSITPKDAGEQFNVLVCDFLSKHPEFQEDNEIDNYYRNTPRNIDQARKAKNHLRKKAQRKDATPEDRIAFKEAIRAHNFLKRQKKKKNESEQSRYLEKLYNKNFWDFSSKACSGTLDTQPQKLRTLPTSFILANTQFLLQWTQHS